jgi:hypothetical protein
MKAKLTFAQGRKAPFERISRLEGGSEPVVVIDEHGGGQARAMQFTANLVRYKLLYQRTMEFPGEAVFAAYTMGRRSARRRLLVTSGTDMRGPEGRGPSELLPLL